MSLYLLRIIYGFFIQKWSVSNYHASFEVHWRVGIWSLTRSGEPARETAHNLLGNCAQHAAHTHTHTPIHTHTNSVQVTSSGSGRIWEAVQRLNNTKPHSSPSMHGTPHCQCDALLIITTPHSSLSVCGTIHHHNASFLIVSVRHSSSSQCLIPHRQCAPLLIVTMSHSSS